MTLVALLVSLFVMPGALAEEPESDFSIKTTVESGCSASGSPRQSPDGKWYMPADAALAEESAATMSPGDVGGPDDFGYTWDDSVTFNWISAGSGINTGMTGSGWDQATGPVSLPFTFKYYEDTYSQVYIAAAGYLAFTEADNWDDQDAVPSPSGPNNVIAPYWTPTYISSGWVRYLSGGTAPNRYFVVEWHDLKGGDSGDSIGKDETYRFEAVLYENGDILFQHDTMSYNDTYWCGYVGIEDSGGLDGLSYMDSCDEIPSNSAVRFYRPAPSARVGIRPLYYGEFARAGETVSFEVPIRNTGDLGADTYDLTVSSSWPVSLYDTSGALLLDTDGDGTADTGSLAQGSGKTIVAKIETPATTNVGDENEAEVVVCSSLDAGECKTVNLQTAVPAPFAQVYRDNADGAMSLELVQPDGQTCVKTTSDWHWGYDVAVAEMPTSFAYVWRRGRSLGSLSVNELEYTLRDSSGNAIRGVSKLTDHSGATMNTYDYRPAVAVAPNGRIGVIWYRYLYNSSNYRGNYNVYYAVLDSAGNIVVPPTNLTNNPYWGSG
jgi:hypothetical protein